MKIADKPMDTISMLISMLGKDVPKDKGHIWFRGQPKKDWKLIPSLGRGRKSVLQTEDYLIKRFRQNATLLVGNTVQSEWDWLLIMQHHGVSTRLLDWTENPLVALYFAVVEKPSSDGALWMLLPSELNMHSKIKPVYSLDIPSLDDPILENYSTKSIRSETKSRMDPIAIMAPRNTPRMQIQKGVFTIMHRDPTPIEDVGDCKHVWRYIINKAKKKLLVKELELLGINKFSLFPELESIKSII